MRFEKLLTDRGIVPLLVTYQTEGERIDYARKEAARIGIPINVALSIRSDDPRGAEIYDAAMNARHRKKPMTPGEIACYWGHREAWRMLLEKKADYGLVLEDDFQVKDPEVMRSAIEAITEMPEFDLLQFWAYQPRGKVRNWPFDNFSVEDRMFGTTGAIGYLISKEGAQKLLARKRIFRPLDEDFIAPWELGLRVYNLNPAPIGETDTLGSLLDNQRVMQISEKKRRFFALWLKARWQVLSIWHWILRVRN